MFLSLCHSSCVPNPILSYVVFPISIRILFYILVLVLSNKNKVLDKNQPSRNIGKKNNRQSQVDRRNNKVISEVKKDTTTQDQHTFFSPKPDSITLLPRKIPSISRKREFSGNCLGNKPPHHITKPSFFSNDDHLHQ